MCPKMLSQRLRKRYYKIFETSVKKSQMIIPSLVINIKNKCEKNPKISRGHMNSSFN